MKKRKKSSASAPAPAAPDAVEVTQNDGDEKTQPYFEPPDFGHAEETTQVTPDADIPIKEGASGSSDGSSDGSWERPTAVADLAEVAGLVAQTTEDSVVEAPIVESVGRLESILESVIFASDRPLGLSEIKRLLNERDGKKLTAALETLQARYQDSGVQLVGVAGGWQFRTHPLNAPWVGKLMAGRPARLSRAMLETLAIIAYRQPITRPEMDDIRGVDCGPVLKTLLDRGLIRMIGKKEEVGRPILYGTTPEFLRTFSLKDLTELPTLREFHELGAAEMAKVDAQTPAREGGDVPVAASAMPPPSNLPTPDLDEEDELLTELDRASSKAASAAKAREPEAEPTAPEATDP